MLEEPVCTCSELLQLKAAACFFQLAALQALMRPRKREQSFFTCMHYS